MNVLLIGSGGREHALAWKLAQSPLMGKLYAAPGNPGIAEAAELAELNPADHRVVIDFCRRHSIGLVVIGPEAPLVDGLADNLRAMGILAFGPNKVPAQLEGSKGFTKVLCARAGIPTARYARASDRLAAEAALDAMFAGGFGSAGEAVVIEEFLEGEEVSFFALVDGETVLPFGSAQDHKRVGDGDTGPNTGGMGAYSPASIFTPAIERSVIAEIVVPTVQALAEQGTPYSGILYAGLMLTAEGPKLIEYNARFGDPECQVLMMRLDSDLLELMAATAKGTLAEAAPPTFSRRAALTVVMAAKGYPGTPKKGGTISGIEEAEAKGAKVFQAGTAARGARLVADGGRVLNVTAGGKTVLEAQRAAYRAVDAIRFPSGFCRRDIGWREVARLKR
ncbi:MAG TPA: phosphoribosylamine--glycine ligase [Amaricoccus sp.]|nr:phosphoribosylamine--glycine ligase [Amaricoccus sp.]